MPAQVVQRERLFARLRDGRVRKLTLLACPAGFGKSTLVKNPANRHRAIGFIEDEWHYALANIHPGKDDNRVNYANRDRAPLLFISGGDDDLMPPSIQRSNAKHYNGATVRDVREFAGPHLLPAAPGWEELADYALDWALRHAR